MRNSAGRAGPAADMYLLRFKRSVRHDLKALGKEVADRIISKIESDLLPDPRRGQPLRGSELSLWRYRIGDYRVLYVFNDDELWVLVARIAHRGDVYRNL
jgi:mRNA interferase RelE/StbE